MILTIGYQRLTPQRLADLATQFNATVIDVRGSLFRCKSGFGRRQLEALLGPRYEYRGDKGLGNRGANCVTADGLAWVVAEGEARNLLLMCQEEAPGDCHRHHLIAVALDCPVFHVYQDDVIEASDLQTAIESGAEEYDCVGLADFVASLEPAA